MKKALDLELEAGARAHFEDPHYYASTYDHTEDVEYYRALAKRRGVKTVLEQGIGNGRVALPMARSGIRVTGIDPSRPMLDHLEERLAKEPPRVRQRVRLVEGDMRETKLRERFPLVICPFNAALHLYSRPDVEAWLARSREHLTARGELVFDISMPNPSDLARDPSTAYRVPPFDHPSMGKVQYREHFDYDAVRQILFVSMYFTPTKRGRRSGDGEVMTPLAHRQFFPQEMEALLHYNNFEVTELYGDWDEGPLTQTSDVMIWHARPRRPVPKRRSS